MKYEVGDRVEILPQGFLAMIKHRFAKGKVFGFITNVNGEYHMVRPAWCKWEAELYRNEIRPA